ncbi:MAG: DnaD domain protein [Candidatus Borkfalkiaceae bacterium]|nr:DnaD domain protein [Clostridia bacterium]MDY6224028.1 DnaD domain protein [Christensenellaceae bacterium]
MSFCSFSKEYAENDYTSIENRFITKYLPEADGFFVKVYLYGLFLCRSSASDFSLASLAEVLKTTEDKIRDAFCFWQDYDLVEIISKEPFAVSYLPVRTATGRPTRINYSRYADFNKELLRKMSKAGKDVGYAQSVKYMQFLDENEMQPQALLLIVEYCISKQGEAVSPSYIFNKAKKFIREGLCTYEQVEKALSSYNAHEKEVAALFAVMNESGAPDETDYSLFSRWTEEYGFTYSAVKVAAKHLKKGTMRGLDGLIRDLYSRGKTAEKEIDAYLTQREALTQEVYRIARKLGAKVDNPAAYVDEYAEKWFNCGFDEDSLSSLASYCFKCGLTDFAALNSLVEDLFEKGIVSPESVREFLQAKNDDLKLFERLRSVCANLKKSPANLAMISTWKSWNFNAELIEEAAKRASSSAAPVAYMNKILSEWKRENIFSLDEAQKEIAASAYAGRTAAPADQSKTANRYLSPAVVAADERSARERYYAALREKALLKAEKNRAKAERQTGFSETEKQLSKMEIDLAKAEMFSPETLPALREEKKALLARRRALLAAAGLTEADLSPSYVCPKCKDTGYLKNGAACDCYKLAEKH